jgi:hypothetical protein
VFVCLIAAGIFGYNRVSSVEAIHEATNIVGRGQLNFGPMVTLSVGIILNRTNGFRALMRLFGRIYNELARPGEYVDSEKFRSLFRRVDVEWNYFSVDNFKPGTSGEASLKTFLETKIFGGASPS